MARLKRGETGLFYGYWFDSKGKKLRRVTRAELGEAYRLMRIGREMGLHKDKEAGSEQPI